MTSELWSSLVRDLPTAGLVLVVVFFAAKYLDRWVDKIANAQSTGAQQRQQEIIVLLERLLAATSTMEKQMSAVIDHNSSVIGATNDTLLRVCEILSSLARGQSGMEAQLTDMQHGLMGHYQDVAARPCQMMEAKPAPRRTSKAST